MEFNGAKIEDNKLESYQYMISRIYAEIDQKRRVSWEDIAFEKTNSPAAKFKFDKFDSLRIKFDKGRNDTLWTKFKKSDFKLRKPFPGFSGQQMKGPMPQYLKSGAMLKRMHDDSLNYTAESTKAKNIIADLVKEKIVTDAAVVKSFGLTNDELVVNDQKQPGALHEKLKAKYGIHENYGFYYGPVNMVGTGVFIGNDEQEAQRLNFKATPFKNKMLVDAKSFPRFKTQNGPELVVSNIIADLVSEKVVKDKSDLASFNLTNSALTVNGVKQPGALHDRLKDKYLTGKNYDWITLDSKGNSDHYNFGFHFDRAKGSMGYGISTDKNDN